MPYINKADKEYLNTVTDAFNRVAITTPGELNYLLTMLIQRYVKGASSKNYQILNDVIGALECCKEEFRRRVVNDYEDHKIKHNGDVYEDEVLR